MAGMIWNANHVLSSALDPKTNGVPHKLFEQDLKGIVLLSTIEAGFIFSGNVGTGLLMARSEGKWSPPCAVGLTGVGWGFIAGASLKDVMVFLFDDATVASIAGDAGIKFGAQGELTLGPAGRNADLSLNLSNKGVGSSVAISFSKGLFGGISIEGAVVGARSAVNETFYGKAVTPLQILYDDTVTIPEKSLMPEIYAKLNKLMEGDTHEPSTEEKEKTEELRVEAVKAGEEASKADDVIEIDAKSEAAKEATA
eukprot:CAMPEP_0119003008 /NCGR_PEP_ID=MMETSP1176-20130426/289_1 /TAXON_ID=265551 /ORGANISM="Synedropsis recta cf, Strain CCMP1620" /LENGTH=253 /DNA_ID=CAMNT_0006954561 /DNA_START=159 /DNA_END=920 /DNA_ORIENTATION=+